MTNVNNNYDFFFSHVMVCIITNPKSLRNDKPILSSSRKVPACKISRFKKAKQIMFFFTHFSYLLQIVPALARASNHLRIRHKLDSGRCPSILQSMAYSPFFFCTSSLIFFLLSLNELEIEVVCVGPTFAFLYGSGLYDYISLVELLEKITTQHAFNVFFTSHRDYPVRIRKNL